MVDQLLLGWPRPLGRDDPGDDALAEIGVGYLQARLNKTWARQGTPKVAASQF